MNKNQAQEDNTQRKSNKIHFKNWETSKFLAQLSIVSEHKWLS